MIKNKAAMWAVLTALPTSAFALESDPGGAIVYSFVGGAVGGFLGALLACWFCCRRRATKDDTGQKTY